MRKRILIHVLLIALLLAVPVVSSPDFDGTLSIFKIQPFIREFSRFVLCIIFFYLNLFVFLPLFFGKRKYFVFAGIILICYLGVVFLPYHFAKTIGTINTIPNNPPPTSAVLLPRDLPPPDKQREMENPPPKKEQPPIPRNNERMPEESLLKKIFTAIIPFLFAFLSSLFIYRDQKQRELKEAKDKAELLNLKYQLQPHFLFNILNSIYSLALMKSEDAPEGILKLSNVMRYVVQESGEDWVELEKELDYLKDYISLQLIRTDNSLDFSYTEIGNPNGYKIAPLILVNFVENAFKYGFNAEEESKISVDVTIEDAMLQFTVFNNIVNKRIQDKESLGVGLKNTLERLEKTYPNQNTTKITNDGETFLVDLHIPLK